MTARTHTTKTTKKTTGSTTTTAEAAPGPGLLLRARRRGHDERGAAMVEFAISSVILAVLLFGIIEGGLAFRAKLSLSNSVDEAARRGAVAGSDPFADYEILQQVVRHSTAAGTITNIVIFRATDGIDEPPTACLTATSPADKCTRYQAADLLRPRVDFGNCIMESGWCPNERSDALLTGDYVGVWISGRFTSPSGALGHIDLSDSAVLPIESKGG